MFDTEKIPTLVQGVSQWSEGGRGGGTEWDRERGVQTGARHRESDTLATIYINTGDWTNTTNKMLLRMATQ